jgi:hypothetical protein
VIPRRPTRRARIDAPTISGSASVYCVECGGLLGGLEPETEPDATQLVTPRYQRTVFMEEIVPRGKRHAATGLPTFGPRNRVRQGQGSSGRRREPGRRGEGFWTSISGPAYVYCPGRHCGLGQVVDPADRRLSASASRQLLR